MSIRLRAAASQTHGPHFFVAAMIGTSLAARPIRPQCLSLVISL